MTNKKIGLAKKGSRFCLQEYIKKNKNKLSQYIIASSFSLISFMDKDLKVEWKSPLEENDFYEYRDDFFRDLDINVITEDIEKKLRLFWPKNGPQWDGIAVVNGKEKRKGILLIEAKSHTSETKSDMKATADKSIDLINSSIEKTQNYMGIKPQLWTNEYYQLANRIAYLYFLNVKLKIPTWLVLINFTDDISYKSTALSEWLRHYNIIASKMGINEDCNLLDKIIMVFIPAL